MINYHDIFALWRYSWSNARFVLQCIRRKSRRERVTRSASANFDDLPGRGAGEREFRLWWGQAEPSESSERARNTCGRRPLRCYRIPADATTRSRVALSARDGFDSAIESRFSVRLKLSNRRRGFSNFRPKKIEDYCNELIYLCMSVCVVNLCMKNFIYIWERWDRNNYKNL